MMRPYQQSLAAFHGNSKCTYSAQHTRGTGEVDIGEVAVVARERVGIWLKQRLVAGNAGYGAPVGTQLYTRR